MHIMIRPVLLASACCALALTGTARADTAWEWHYAGTGITAGGTLTTGDAPDAQGFYEVLSVSGTRNGDVITGLYPTGQAIPGNEPYTLDNLIRPGPEGLTVHGLGFAMASGTYANPFFATFLSRPGYLEVLTGPGTYSELPIQFSAAPIPEPSSVALLASGLVLTGVAVRRRRQRAPAAV